MSNNKVRVHRKSQYMNAMRDIGIYINDTKVGTIGNGETKTFKIPTSKFILNAKIDWCYSQKLELQAKNNEPLNVELASAKILSRSISFSLAAVLLVFIADYFSLLDLGSSPYAIVLSPFLLILLYYFSIGRRDYIVIKRI